MKPKGKPGLKPGSKIPTTRQNTNKKKSGAAFETKKLDKAFYKKNEFALILLGAFLLTIIIFFIFFRSSGSEVNSIVNKPSARSFADLEKRIEALEISLKKDGRATGSGKDKAASGSDPLESRITRLETNVLIKFESLTERIDSFEKKIVELKKKSIVPKPVAAKTRSTISTVKKVKKVKKAPMFHTVQKKETLYSISKKYKTTVKALKKLNNLSEKDKIYPGDNIIIK